MNIKKVNIDIIEKVKSDFTTLYKDTLRVSTPFFILHKNILLKWPDNWY